MHFNVSGGLSLLDGGVVLPVDSTSELLDLGKLVEGKDLLAQVRPGTLGLDPLNHQSKDMD